MSLTELKSQQCLSFVHGTCRIPCQTVDEMVRLYRPLGVYVTWQRIDKALGLTFRNVRALVVAAAGCTPDATTPVF